MFITRPWPLAAVLVLVLLLLIGLGYWRGTSVGPQVQVPMFYDAHYLFPRPWTQEQAAPGVPDAAPLAFYGQNRISQLFISGNDNLSMLELWLAGQPQSVVDVLLQDDRGLLFSGQITLTEGQDGGYYQFQLPTIKDAQGRSFLLTLMAPQATIDRPVVARTVGGDRLGGSLQLNEYNRPGNLALRTYARGWPGIWWLEALGEQILPAIFRLRLQQYKPDLFKGSFFTVGLLLTLLLSVAYLILASPNNRRRPKVLGRALGWAAIIIMAIFLFWQLSSGRVKLPFIGNSQALTATAVIPQAALLAEQGQRLVRDIISDLWTLEREPEARFIKTELFAGLPALRVPANSAINYGISMPPDSYLRAGTLGEGNTPISFSLQVNGETVTMHESAARDNPGAEDISWFHVDLSSWSGQDVLLRLVTEGKDENGEGLWIMPQLGAEPSWLLPDPLPESIAVEPAGFEFGETVELIGYAVRQPEMEGGQTAAIDLFWRPLKNTDAYATVFVHLLDASGNLVAQHDGQPVNNAYPLPIWQPGAIIQDTHELILPADLSAGAYRLLVGLYDSRTLQRWPVIGPDGMTLPDDAALLDIPIEVMP